MTNKISMYLGSLDHCPSEQLVNPGTWHTTVLVLSKSGVNLADVSSLLIIENEAAKKWSKTSSRHKLEFETKLRTVPNSLYIFAIRAQGKTIEKSFLHMISELGLTSFVQETIKNNKPYFEFGPFIRIELKAIEETLQEIRSSKTFPIVKNQAIPLIFICHFLMRTH